MKNLTILTFLLLAIAPCALSQNPFYDAQELAKFKYILINGCPTLIVSTNEDSSTIAKILKKYKPNATNYKELAETFSQNPFFKIPYSASQSVNTSTFNIAAYANEFGKGLGQLGGLDVTTLADGFAKFIVERTKLELNAAFFSRFQEEIEKPEYKDLQTIFPQTYRALTTIGEEIYNYEGYLQTLRECFKNDLNNLTNTLPSIVDNHPDFFAKFPELEALLNSGCYLASELKNKVHPGDILNSYPITYLDKLSPDSKGAIQTLQLISASLRKFPIDNKSYWVSTAQLNELVGDKVAFRIYLGLIYQQAILPPYNSIKFSQTTLVAALSQVATDFNNGYDKYAAYLYQFEGKVNSLKQLMDSYQTPMKDSLAVEFYVKYANASLDIFKQATQAGKLPYINLPQLADTLHDFFDVAQTACDLTLAINRCNYGAAIVNGAHIYDVVISKHLNQPLNGTTVGVTFHISPKVKEKLFLYGSLMASVAQAKTSDEVKTAIDAIALPPGSARTKRESAFNVSVNAYCGIYAGYEKIKGIDHGYQEVTFKKWNSYGVTAPIGFAISTGQQHVIPFINKWCSKQRHWSHTLFVSVVDIGALTAFRFAGDSTSTAPKVELKDIISPGLFYSIGIPKSPISVNVGYQLGPLLRNVTATQNSYNNSYTRFSVSICVDIPVLNLYNKPR